MIKSLKVFVFKNVLENKKCHIAGISNTILKTYTYVRRYKNSSGKTPALSR